MAKKKFVNKTRQAILIPVLSKSGTELKRLQVGAAIELSEDEVSPQVEMLIARRQMLVQDVAPPRSTHKSSGKDEN